MFWAKGSTEVIKSQLYYIKHNEKFKFYKNKDDNSAFFVLDGNIYPFPRITEKGLVFTDPETGDTYTITKDIKGEIR